MLPAPIVVDVHGDAGNEEERAHIPARRNQLRPRSAAGRAAPPKVLSPLTLTIVAIEARYRVAATATAYCPQNHLAARQVTMGWEPSRLTALQRRTPAL